MPKNKRDYVISRVFDKGNLVSCGITVVSSRTDIKKYGYAGKLVKNFNRSGVNKPRPISRQKMFQLIKAFVHILQ